MLGQMQSQPLLISSLTTHAERHHASTEIVSRRVEGDIHRSNWGQIARRARQVANALDGLHLAAGGRVATLAWNGISASAAPAACCTRSTRACTPSSWPGS